MKKIIFLFIFLLTNSLLYASFEHINIFPEAEAQSKAFTSVSGSSESIFFNPAGISTLKYNIFQINYSTPYNLTAINYFAFIFIKPYIWKGTIGFAWTHISTSDKSPIKKVSEERVYLSYGFKITKFLFTGLNSKFFTAKYITNKSSLFSFDFSLLLNINNIFSLGILFKNIYSPEYLWYSNNREILNNSIVIGTGINLHGIINIYYDYNGTTDMIGVSIPLLKKKLNLKAGISIYKNKFNYSSGLNYKIKGVKIYYTIIYHYILGTSHIYGIGFQF